MSELLHQLGIDWRLLFSQAANFLILLIVLRIFAYTPLMKLLHERRARIEEGLTKADEADRRLAESNEVMKMKIKEAEHEALEMMKVNEEKVKQMEHRLLEEAKKKQEAVLAETELIVKAKAEEMRRKIEREAVELIKQGIVKTVEMNPKEIDEQLISKALQELKRA